jgi:hypothetical protein
MTAVIKNHEGHPVHPALSTWQWLGVIAVIVGGTIGIDQRMQATVRVFADSNNQDHQRIRQEISAIVGGLPPDWLVKKVDDNSSTNAAIKNDLSAIRVSLAELKSALQAIGNNNP